MTANTPKVRLSDWLFSIIVNELVRVNRKRIGLAMKTLESMSADDKTNMLEYIDGYCEQKLKFDQQNQKFEISTDEDLKLLVYGNEQRFYTTPMGMKSAVLILSQQWVKEYVAWLKT